MRVGRAKRRWLRWGRYVAATQSRASRSRGWGTECHAGQIRAYGDVMYARRWAPIGARTPWYPSWMTAREENLPKPLRNARA